jgi:hypothetical protein
MDLIMGSPADVESKYEAMKAQWDTLGIAKLNAYWTTYFTNKQAQIDQLSGDLK